MEYNPTGRKILVITPRFPFDFHGACEQDRAHGIFLLKKLGYEVHVICMCFKRHLEDISKAETDWGIQITPVLYKNVNLTRAQKLYRSFQRVFIPLYWDGAAHEYRDKEVQHVVTQKIEVFKPDLVWFDSTYLWPLHHIPKTRNIPIVTRSLNYEPLHFYGKTGKTLFDYIRYRVKVYGEERALKGSDLLFSITPREKNLYESIGDTPVVNLPLRRLALLIGKNAQVTDRTKLNVCFMGSNYSVHHMLQALIFVLEQVNPLLQERYPNTFTINIIGGKMPKHIAEKNYKNVVIHGYIPNLDAFLADMDIALSPSLSGEGMQQKVFEPIVRGIPTITSSRALAGYSFFDGIHLLTVNDTPGAFVTALGSIRSYDERCRLSRNAIKMAESQFGTELLSELIHHNIDKVLTKS